MEKTIYARRSVVSAAQRLEALADSNNEAKPLYEDFSRSRALPSPLDLAEQKIADCLAAEDRAGMKFWRGVWIHLMREKYAPGSIHIIEHDDGALPSLHERVPDIQ